MALYLDTTIHAGQAVAPVPLSERASRARPFDLGLLILPLRDRAGGGRRRPVHSRSLFAVLLVADLWLLGYHHVVATYTRLAFDTRSLRRNRFLAVDLLVLVTIVTLGVAMTAGAWVIATAFLYLQWFHYMRQGYGIARMYSGPPGRTDRPARVTC